MTAELDELEGISHHGNLKRVFLRLSEKIVLTVHVVRSVVSTIIEDFQNSRE